MKQKSSIIPPAMRIIAYLFTLIELLVVVAILSILLSMLLPSLRKARDKAHEIACLNNLKQVGLSTTMYANDNQLIFAAYDGKKAWARTLVESGSLKDEEVTYCPVNEPTGSYNAFTYAMFWDYYFSDAGAPGLPNGSGGDWASYCNYRRIEKPSEFFMFSDSIEPEHDRQRYLVYNNDQDNYYIHFRHSRQANAWFFDGHATGGTWNEMHRYTDCISKADPPFIY